MHILHLEASPGWGGQEMRILKEAEGMRQKGHTVILAVMKNGLLINHAKSKGFIVYALHFKRIYWFFTLFSLFGIVARHRIDIINTHSSLDAWVGGICAKLTGKKVVRTRHLSTHVKPGINSRLLYGFLADRIVTTCSSIVPVLCKQAKKPLIYCRSIPTGVDPQKITISPAEVAQWRKKWGENHCIVGTACFMRSWKGIDDFLKAADLLRENQNIRWVIIGGGHTEKYIKMAQDLKLEGHVHFTGHLEFPFSAIKALDIFALLSTANEGVSQAILQAAYLEKPLIATPTGGLGEVCIDKVTGIQVPIFSPSVVQKAVLELAQNVRLREQYGKKAKALVEEKFTHGKMIEEMELFYKSLSAI